MEHAPIARRPGTRALCDDQVDDAVRRYKRGESWVTIAKDFEVDPATIGKELKRHGVVMRPRRGATAHRDDPA